MSTPEDQQRWGAELASVLQGSFPSLAETVRSGMTADCSELFKTQDPRLIAFCTTIENAMHYLIDQNTALQADLDMKKDQIVRLSEAILDKPLAPAPSSTHRKSRDPEKFGGTEKDISKRQKEYANWRSQVIRCLNVDEAVFHTEYLRIMHIASLLTDNAYDLHRIHFETVTNNKHNPEHWHWNTTEAVFRDLNAQYETLDLSREARRKLDDLLMKNKPFPTFLAEFQVLASQCGKTNEQMAEQLRVKVSQELFDEIAHQRNLPHLADFPAWCKLYQELWDNLETQKHDLKLRNAHPGASRPRQNPATSSPSQPTLTQPQPATTGDPMVLDAARNAPPSREECFAKGLCFYCKKQGHTKKDCEEAKQANARWASLGRGRPPQMGRGWTQWPQQPISSAPSSPRLSSPAPPRHLHVPTPVQPAWNQRVRVLEYNDAASTSSPSPPGGTPVVYTPAYSTPAYSPVYPQGDAQHPQDPQPKE